MRPLPARVLLAALCIGAFAAGLRTSQLIFFVVAFGSAVLLGTSLSTSRRPVTHALQTFRNQAVEVRLWGAPPSDVSDTTLVLTSVNALSAGVHVFFSVRGGGSMHLKIAQPGAPRSLSVYRQAGEVCSRIWSLQRIMWRGRSSEPLGSCWLGDLPEAESSRLIRPPAGTTHFGTASGDCVSGR